MTKNYKKLDIEKKITLKNGDFLALVYENLKDKQELKYDSRNIYLFRKNGDFVWRIKSTHDSDGNFFTNIYVKDGEIRAYRWNGGVYKIDLDNGIAIPLYLAR